MQVSAAEIQALLDRIDRLDKRLAERDKQLTRMEAVADAMMDKVAGAGPPGLPVVRG